MKKINDLFIDNQFVSTKMLGALSFLWITLFIIYRLYDANFNVDHVIDNWAKDTRFFLETTFMIVTNILAAMIFARFYSKKESNRVSAIKDLSQPDFMKEVLMDIAHYKGIYCEDHDVYVKLRRQSNNCNILICELTYKYKKSLINKDVNFTIYRITKETDHQKIPLIADECLKNEFVWYNDETDFDGIVDETENASKYTVSDLVIDGKPITNLPRFENNSKDIITYSYTLEKEPKSMSLITFKVTLPIEFESAITITAEFPSNRGEIVFDYSEIKNDIALASFSRTGIKSNPVDFGDKNGIRKFQHNGWLLPKDGYVFSWWKKAN